MNICTGAEASTTVQFFSKRLLGITVHNIKANFKEDSVLSEQFTLEANE
jgi:hypothetical protein